jgi:hypothetical protein
VPNSSKKADTEKAPTISGRQSTKLKATLFDEDEDEPVDLKASSKLAPLKVEQKEPKMNSGVMSLPE